MRDSKLNQMRLKEMRTFFSTENYQLKEKKLSLRLPKNGL
jgi:hypothetical protein